MKWQAKRLANFHNVGQGILLNSIGGEKMQFDLPTAQLGGREYIIYLGDREIIVECNCCFHYRFLLNLENRQQGDFKHIQIS